MVNRTQLLTVLLLVLVALSCSVCLFGGSQVEYFSDESRGPYGQSDLAYSRFVTNEQEPLNPNSQPLVITSLPGGIAVAAPPPAQQVPTKDADLEAAPMLGPAVSPTVRTTVPRLFGMEAASATSTTSRPSTVPPPADGRIALPPSQASLAMVQNLTNA